MSYIDSKIHGDDVQIVEIGLDPGEAVQAEPGVLFYKSPAIEMSTGTGGGFFSAVSRSLSGEDFFTFPLI